MSHRLESLRTVNCWRRVAAMLLLALVVSWGVLWSEAQCSQPVQVNTGALDSQVTEGPLFVNDNSDMEESDYDDRRCGSSIPATDPDPCASSDLSIFSRRAKTRMVRARIRTIPLLLLNTVILRL